MNSVQLNQRTIFLVIGYPGAGKSYFSRQFAEVIDGIHLSDDRIRHELFGEPSYDKNEHDVVSRIRNYILDEMVKSEKSIIIDANLNKAERKRIREQLRPQKSPIVTIWVQTDLETSFTRASNRDRRQTDDKYTTSMSFEVFDKIQKHFRRPDRDEAVVISGKHLFKTQLVSVVRKLAQSGLVMKLTTVNQAPIEFKTPTPPPARVDPTMRYSPPRR
jgi:predicted kinase